MSNNVDPFKKYFEEERAIVSCETIHPLVAELLDELFMADDRSENWGGRLTDVESQMRDCLTNELREMLIPMLPPALQVPIMGTWNSLSQVMLTIAWLAAKQITPRFEENK